MENKEKEIMTFEEALDFCRTMSKSQGFYGRLVNSMEEFTEEQKTDFEKVLKDNNVRDNMDLIFLLEC